MAVMEDYAWLVVVGALAAFTFGFATGSNDVGNAFATSVGSKTLSLRSAVIIAAIFEFAGSLALGRVSTNTIASGIADVKTFEREPEIFAYGMVCALAVGGIFQILASYFEANVSATHCIVGGIIGFSLVYKGKGAVQWAVHDSSSFPPVKGVVSIVLTWVIAPVITALASALFFVILRTLILRRKGKYDAYYFSFFVWPVAVFATVFINAFFIFTKGIKKALSKGNSWTDQKALWVSAVIAGGCMLLSILCIFPLKWYMDRSDNTNPQRDEAAAAATAVEEGRAANEQDAKPQGEIAAAAADTGARPSWWQKFAKAATHGMDVDIHKDVEEDELVKAIHGRAEVFDPKVEAVFKYLQVFSAICVIFAHGAGEVGYMAGPLTSIYDIYSKGQLVKNASPKIWVLLISAFGLVFGLATYGYNVTHAMGVRMAKLTATRGFCAELATAFTIMIASQHGLPTSSSQCITGAIMGVGLCEGLKGVSWRVVLKQFVSWVFTLVVVGGATAALFAQGVYSPSAVSGKQVVIYEDRITNMTTSLYKEFNSTLQDYRPAADAGALAPRLTNATWADLNTTIATNSQQAKNLTDGKTQTVRPEAVLEAFQSALALYEEKTVLTLGQMQVFPGAPLCNGAAVQDLASNATTGCKPPRLVPKAGAASS